MSTQTAVKPSLTLKRHLKAPPAKVFAAWIDPEKIKRWMGPGEVKAVSAECDARVGGRYRWVMQSPDGENTTSAASIAKSSRTRNWFSPGPGNRRPSAKSLVTVLLKPDGDGTLLTLTHEQFFDEEARDRHQQGWNGALDKMEQFLS